MHAFVPCILSQDYMVEERAIVACVAGGIVLTRKLYNCFVYSPVSGGDVNKPIT